MKKNVLNLLSKFALALLIFSFNSCGNKEENKDEKVESMENGEQKTESTQNYAQKIEGIWESTHEPYAYVFKADGKYEMLETSPADSVIKTGVWKIEGANLVLTDSEQQVDSRKINFVNEMLFLGEIPTFDPKCMQCEYQNASEYVAEMGLKKRK